MKSPNTTVGLVTILFLFIPSWTSAQDRTVHVSPERAWELGWPAIHGPSGNFVAPQTGAELVDDLSQARLVWESQENDFGRAKHTTGTFKGRGKVTAVLGPDAKKYPGSWAAPIIAEGKLFATSFRPTGKIYDVKTRFGGTEPAYLEAEDLLIALDAKTGKRLWKAEEPGGFVWGVGKRQGFQVAPVYYEGVVFSMGTTGRIFAYTATDSRKLWSTKPEPQMIEQRNKFLANPHVLQASARFGWQQSLVVAGGTLIVPRQSRLLGLDPKTGKRKWERKHAISPWATPSLWRHQGQEYLLTATVDKPHQAEMHLIDPEQGKILWTVEGLHAGSKHWKTGESRGGISETLKMVLSEQLCVKIASTIPCPFYPANRHAAPNCRDSRTVAFLASALHRKTHIER